MPLKPHPTDPDKLVFVKPEYNLKKPWVGLTDEEIETFVAHLYPLPEKPVRERLRVLLTKLEERNT